MMFLVCEKYEVRIGQFKTETKRFSLGNQLFLKVKCLENVCSLVIDPEFGCASEGWSES